MPVLLAAFAVIGGVAGAERIYGLVFIAVLTSVVAQGTLVPIVAPLGIPMRVHDRLPWELSVRVGSEPTGAREHRVAHGSRADGMALADLPPRRRCVGDAVVRDGDALQPDPEIELRPATGC